MVHLNVVLLLTTVIIVVLAIRLAGITFKGFPVLMYHQVIDSGTPDYLKITTRQLELQFDYLVKKKYNTIFLSDLLDHIEQNKPLPLKAILLSFDDGYKDNFTNLYPLLKKYGLKANIFLVAGFISSPENHVIGKEGFLSTEEIGKMSSETVQFGLHTYDHKSYKDLTIPEIEDDMEKCKTRLNLLKIPYQPCMAYTYGAYPKRNLKKRMDLFNALQQKGIRLAFRIGNRLNPLPIKDKMLVQRMDIRGDQPFVAFKWSLVLGSKVKFK